MSRAMADARGGGPTVVWGTLSRPVSMTLERSAQPHQIAAAGGASCRRHAFSMTIARRASPLIPRGERTGTVLTGMVGLHRPYARLWWVGAHSGGSQV